MTTITEGIQLHIRGGRELSHHYCNILNEPAGRRGRVLPQPSCFGGGYCPPGRPLAAPPCPRRPRRDLKDARQKRVLSRVNRIGFSDDLSRNTVRCGYSCCVSTYIRLVCSWILLNVLNFVSSPFSAMSVCKTKGSVHPSKGFSTRRRGSEPYLPIQLILACSVLQLSDDSKFLRAAWVGWAEYMFIKGAGNRDGDS